jgi:hypothetical protein
MRAVGGVVEWVHVRGLIASSAALVVAAGTLFGASSASADSVWHQSYQRASQSEACVAQPGETPWQASWGADSSWHPSWEQWANGGTGGWTCTRAIVWARTPVAAESSSVMYRVGDVGPGGGLVFLISGGLTYEMAPKTWGAAETSGLQLCDTNTDIAGTGTAVGTGSANTAAITAAIACSSNAAAAARAYDGGGLTDWFLPSRDELNAMCNYSRNPTIPAAPSVACSGAQDGAFATGAYGFAFPYYWSSSQEIVSNSWYQLSVNGFQGTANQVSSYLGIRPIRTS